MPKTTHPRRGNLQFMPRNKAASIVPHINSWAIPKNKPEIKLLGFAGYKVGQTHGLFVENNPKSPLVGQERFVPITVLETPPLKVVGLRFYSGDRSSGEIWSDSLPKEIGRRINRKKGGGELKPEKEDAEKLSADDIKLILCAQPSLAGFGKKKPEIMEYALAGSLTEKLNYAKEMLGKEIRARDVFKEGDMVDVFAVTKGKGFQGPVKRHGVTLLPNPTKVKRSRRKPANIGGWRPKHTLWQVPMGGQMGFQQRCEYNKKILKLAEGGLKKAGGWKHYGQVLSDVIFIAGSVPGPSKRLVKMRFALRPPKRVFEAPALNFVNIIEEGKEKEKAK